MVAPIDFYFDFSSPYGYLASYRVDEIAAEFGRAVAWRPYLLGVAFKNTGQSPLVSQPIRGTYALRDMERTARKQKVPLILPEGFPMATMAAGRAFYWLDGRDPKRAVDLAKALYRAAAQSQHRADGCGSCRRWRDRSDPRRRRSAAGGQGNGCAPRPSPIARASARLHHRRRRAVLG
jgi:2-hydroxychromene-2-carboxylate isomerase